MTATAARDLIAEWLEIRTVYITLSSAAAQLDVKPSALEWAIKKARARGDTRVPTNLRKVQPAHSDSPHHVMTQASVRRRPEQDGWAARVVAGHPNTTTGDVARILGALGINPAHGKLWALRGKPVLVVPRRAHR